MISRLNLSFGFTHRLRRRQFEQKVQAQLPMLFRMARGIADQPNDAEDLVHDTCVKALTSFDRAKYNDDGQLGAWLKRILVNTFRDSYRRTARSPIKPNEYHATSDDWQNVVELVPSTDSTPLESIEHRDSSRAIQHAFAALPPEVRVVSVLFLINGLSYKDIASIADSPIGTVMSRLSRGRRLLRNSLAEYDNPEIAQSTGKSNEGEKT